MYHCATRIEKGRNACENSPTMEEEWIKQELGRRICGGDYNEEVVRKRVEKIRIASNGKLKITLF